MNESEIDALLSKRDKILSRRDGLIDSKRIASIEAKLSTVEPGRDNRVDLALGRMCATLERYAPKPGWFQNPAVTLEDDETKRLIETTRRMWNEAKPIEY